MSSNYYCETEPIYTSEKKRHFINETKNLPAHQYMFRDEDFEKIVEYTESDEDEGHDQSDSK